MPHHSTMYIDMACCYRPSSLVCLSICHSSETCKNGWTDRDAVWVVDSGGPKKPCIRWCAHWHDLTNAIAPSMSSSDVAFLSNYFDHLLVLTQRTRFVGHHEEHSACKKIGIVICLQLGANDLHMVQLLPLASLASLKSTTV